MEFIGSSLLSPTLLEIFNVQALSPVQNIFIPVAIIMILISTGIVIRDSFSKKSIGFFSVGFLFGIWIINKIIQISAIPEHLVQITGRTSLFLESILFIIPIFIIASLFIFSKKLTWWSSIQGIIILAVFFVTTRFSLIQTIPQNFLIIIYSWFLLSTLITTWYGQRLSECEPNKIIYSGNRLMIRSIGIVQGIFFLLLLIESIYPITLVAQIFPLVLIGSVFYLGFKLAKQPFFSFSVYPSEVFVYTTIGLTTSLFIIPNNFARIIILFITIGILIFLTYFIARVNRQQESQRTELENANRQLQTTDATKNEFLSFATHQLRSPLTSFKWGLDAITDSLKKTNDTDSIAVTQQLRIIADNMIDTVNNLLDLSKIEQGGLVMNNENIDLVELLDKISEEYRIIANNKQLNLVFVPEIPTATIVGDKTKLRQVFGNIIDNAIKYTDQGMITVHLSQKKDYYETVITDTGSGIPEEDLKKLFGKFSRGIAGKSQKTGSGLGLYLSKKITELHNGKISVHSEGINRGSKFTIKIPVHY